MWTIVDENKSQIELPVIDEALELESPAQPKRSGRDGPRAVAWLKTALSLLAIMFLLLALPIQLFMFRPQLLAAYPSVYERIETACQNRCPFQLPPRVDTDAFEMSGLSYADHPYLANTVILEFNIQNRGNFTQALPDAVIRFTNMSGDPVINQRVAAADYLPADRQPLPLRPGEVASAQIAFTEPGADAVNYEVTFVKPTSLPRAIQP